MIQAIRAGLAAGTRRLPRMRLLRIRTVRRFARGEDGIAAVEFGIVAAPFLALMFAIMETAIVVFASQTLETAVADSARLIMTGQAQSSSFTEAQFVTGEQNKATVDSYTIANVTTQHVNGSPAGTVVVNLTRGANTIEHHSVPMVQQGGRWYVCGEPY